MKGIKTKFSISKLFYNDKFVMLFSVLVAFVIWVSISTTSQETTLYSVTDVPISLPELSNDLKFFNTEDLKADVKISGNAIVVAGISSSDIFITANDTSHITSPGTYKIALVPKKMGIMTDYSFEPSASQAVSPSSIDVFVDRYAEKEITLTDRIDVSSLAKDVYASATIFSQPSVKVSGAESVINRISEAAAVYKFTDPISATSTVEANIVFYDSAGNEISKDYIETDITSVSATVPILKIKTVDIVPNIINAPDSFKLSTDDVTIEPSTIQLAVPDDAEDIYSISTAEIDLSKVDLNNNSFDVELVIPSGFRNLNQITTAKVTFEQSKLAAKKITLSSFTVVNEIADRKATVSTKSIDVTLIGDSEQIKSITAANLTAVVDMSTKSTLAGFVEMPVTININSKFPFCWTYGSYQVDVNITDINADESSE
ncbi:MAG: hypothetical protein IJ861_10275 [Clostridia bacterium]|nr:hypothetical protein [Clostridia bacterium]